MGQDVWTTQAKAVTSLRSVTAVQDAGAWVGNVSNWRQLLDCGDGVLFRFTIFWEIIIKIMSEESVVSLQFRGF